MSKHEIYRQMTQEERQHFVFTPSWLTLQCFRAGFLVLGQSLVCEGLVLVDRKTGERYHASLNSIMERVAT